MLTWNDLQENAKKVLANTPSGDYKDISFTCGSGGSPANKCNLPEVHRADNKEYNTTANGWAYSGEVIIRCRETNTKDKKGREIYETETGQCFVFYYFSGDPSCFDRGILQDPSI